MALEQIREKEEQLKQFMTVRTVGRLAKVSSQGKDSTARGREAAKRKRKQIIEISIVTFLIIVGLGILACFVLLIPTHKDDYNGISKVSEESQVLTKQKWRTKSGKPA